MEFIGTYYCFHVMKMQQIGIKIWEMEVFLSYKQPSGSLLKSLRNTLTIFQKQIVLDLGVLGWLILIVFYHYNLLFCTIHWMHV